MPHYHGLPFNWWQPPIQYYFFQLRVMKRNELGKWSVKWTSNNLDNDESIELTWNHLNVRMNKIINSNRKEAEKLKHALTQYKPKFDEVALCDAIMKEGKNDSDKYSYQLLEAWVNINKASFTVPFEGVVVNAPIIFLRMRIGLRWGRGLSSGRCSNNWCVVDRVWAHLGSLTKANIIVINQNFDGSRNWRFCLEMFITFIVNVKNERYRTKHSTNSIVSFALMCRLCASTYSHNMGKVNALELLLLQTSSTNAVV